MLTVFGRDNCRDVSREAHHEATARVDVWRQWLKKNVFTSDSYIAVMPIGTVAPNYRDQWEA